MKKLFISSALTLIIFSFFASVSHARKVLPFLKSAGTKVVSATKGVSASVRFRSDRRAVVINFSNLTIASKVDYFLSYSTKGTTQGARGAITSDAGGSAARELLFGTCSHGVCRYDNGITNAKLVVTTTLSSGKKVIKTFKLKV